MRALHITPHPASVQTLIGLPTEAPASGYYWVACTRQEFVAQLPTLQAMLTQLQGAPLLDLHVSDLQNAQLPSNYDYTSLYDILVFRRLASSAPTPAPAPVAAPAPAPATSDNPAPVLQRIETQPVAFALFDHVLLTVHPDEGTEYSSYAQRLLSRTPVEGRPSSTKLPPNAADLMLRMINTIVDGYLDLRRDLTRQLDHWQIALLKPRERFSNWNGVLDARLALHQLDEICEDQRAAILDWIEALDGWPLESADEQLRERELLKVRSRDVLEHIERVAHHVRRLEQSAETAVQMHFSVQSNRANEIMRTLTTVTAVFLPLNLIAGIFGMNFEFIPFVHKKDGFWWAVLCMGAISTVLIGYFWRKRFLDREENA